jgi:hypothetical protein
MLIVMYVCLLASPGTCREERISLSVETVNGMACLVRAEEMIAEWKNVHPQWRIERWRCAPPGSVGNDI